MSLAGGLRELLRPPPHRGPLIAAGARGARGRRRARRCCGSTTGVPRGVHVAILLVGGALLYWLGAQAPNEDGEPPAYQSVLLATGAAAALRRAADADVLGADFDGSAAGRAAVDVGRRRRAGAVAGVRAQQRDLAADRRDPRRRRAARGVVVVFDAQSLAPYRWLMALYAAALVLCSLALREPAPPPRRGADRRRRAGDRLDRGCGALARRDGRRAARRSGRSSCSARASGWSPSARSTARPAPPTSASSTWSLFILVVAERRRRRCSGGRWCCSPAASDARRRPAPAPAAAAGARPLPRGRGAARRARRRRRDRRPRATRFLGGHP